jgi:hypothetical protein
MHTYHLYFMVTATAVNLPVVTSADMMPVCPLPHPSPLPEGEGVRNWSLFMVFEEKIIGFGGSLLASRYGRGGS